MARVQLPSSTQHLEVRTPDGESLKGIRTPSREEAAQNAPTLLGFGKTRKRQGYRSHFAQAFS